MWKKLTNLANKLKIPTSQTSSSLDSIEEAGREALKKSKIDFISAKEVLQRREAAASDIRKSNLIFKFYIY